MYTGDSMYVNFKTTWFLLGAQEEQGLGSVRGIPQGLAVSSLPGVWSLWRFTEPGTGHEHFSLHALLFSKKFFKNPSLLPKACRWLPPAHPQFAGYARGFALPEPLLSSWQTTCCKVTTSTKKPSFLALDRGGHALLGSHMHLHFTLYATDTPSTVFIEHLLCAKHLR